MLTATYSQVAIEAEQTMVRRTVERMHQFIQTSWKAAAEAHLGWTEVALQGLRHFNAVYQGRKLDQYVIPALAEKTQEADALITELHGLKAQCNQILLATERHVSQGRAVGAFPVQETCMSLNSYCDKVLVGLKREQEELLPLARRVLSVEEWFGIAAKILSDQRYPGRRDSSLNDWIPPASATRTMFMH